MRALSYKYPAVANFVLAPFFMHSDFLFSGCVIAFLLFYKADVVVSRIKKTPPLFVYFSILLLWFFTKFEYHPVYDKIFIPVSGTIINASICFLLLYFIVREETWGFKFLNLPYIAFIGKLSYSLYVWQQLFLVPNYYGISDFWWTQFPQNVCLIFVAALLSYQLVEKPFLKLKERFALIKT